MNKTAMKWGSFLFFGVLFAFPMVSCGETRQEGKATEQEQTEASELPEKFQKLYEENEHIIGWLKAGKTIEYPVVMFDNSFYLDHDFRGNSDKNGTLFVNAYNQMIPRDDVILIHGHNMKNGDMFGLLSEYESYEYAREYPIISFQTIYDREEVLYAPVSVFNASMVPEAQGYFDLMRIDFADDEILYDAEPEEAAGETEALTEPEEAAEEAEALTESEEAEGLRRSREFDAYIREIRELSEWESPIEINTNDELLVLVTCSYEHEDGRLMVICRKLREGETQEEIRLAFQNAD